MIRCFNCGTDNMEGTKYCNNCGALLNVPQFEEPSEAIPVAEAIPQPVQQNMPHSTPQPAVQQAPKKEKNDSVCFAGFLTSLISILCCGMTSIVGLGLSIWGFIRVKKSGKKGEGMAIAGMVISGIFVLIFIISYISGAFNRLTGGNTDLTTEATTTEVTTEATTTTTEATTTTAVTEDPTEGSSESSEESSAQTSKASGIRPEFKEAMDSYEAFYTRYCNFLKKMSKSNNPSSMMSEYLKMVEELNDYTAKIDAIDESELTDEELKSLRKEASDIMQELTSNNKQIIKNLIRILSLPK